MNKKDDKYWLAFASIEKIGSVFIKTLFNHFGSIELAWNAHVEDLHQIESVDLMQISTIHKFAKEIIQDTAMEYGLGVEFKISSSEYAKEQVYEKYLNSFIDDEVQLKSVADIISQSAVSATKSHNIKAIFAYTDTGLTAGLISRFRPQTHIIGATPNEHVFRQLDLLWGVHPILTPVYNTTDEMFKIANDIIKEHKIASVGDKVLITCGTPKKYGGTNLIKIINVE
jgi:hypothetical protein